MVARIGSLFSGTGGLDLAVEAVTGATPAWFCEFDPAPSKILAHHWPDVPNLGDITAVDWSQVEPVDIITGGSPCQDLSHAGARRGMTEGTRSNLWVAMREAIAALRPATVVWENVRGAYSAEADSAVEPCPGCVGDGPAVALRALGRVLGDLADLGFDCRWHGLRAADVGAPHGRFRVFIVATDTRGEVGRGWAGLRANEPRRLGRARPDNGAMDAANTDGSGLEGVRAGADATPLAGVGRGRGTPADADGWGCEIVAQPHSEPQQTATDRHPCGRHVDRHSGAQYEPATRAATTADTSGARLREHTRESPTEETRPNASDEPASHRRPRTDTDWGPYRPAVERWEHTIGRVAPAPTETGPKGGQRLSPRFVEWMMGLPDGWVCDVPGISRNDQLKALGNGVVPQQAAAAIAHMATAVAA